MGSSALKDMAGVGVAGVKTALAVGALLLLVSLGAVDRAYALVEHTHDPYLGRHSATRGVCDADAKRYQLVTDSQMEWYYWFCSEVDEANNWYRVSRTQLWDGKTKGTHTGQTKAVAHQCPESSVWDAELQACAGAEDAEDPGECGADGGEASSLVGNPVSVATGSKVQVEVDYIGGGPFPIVFSRSYNSGPAADGGR
jgi:hypothetical protein